VSARADYLSRGLASSQFRSKHKCLFFARALFHSSEEDRGNEIGGGGAVAVGIGMPTLRICITLKFDSALCRPRTGKELSITHRSYFCVVLGL